MPVCPVIMKLWTSTYVLAAGAWSFATLAVFYWLIDVKGWRRWAFALRAVGMNSIAVYILNRTGLMWAVSRYFFSGVASLSDTPGYRTAVLAAGDLLANVLLMCFLCRRKVFFKV